MIFHYHVFSAINRLKTARTAQ